MYTPTRLASAAALLSLTAALANAQNVISAHSGTVHYFEGAVTIDGTAVQAQKGKFNSLKDQSVLATQAGRAEVLLTPGVFLRIGENTSIRMLDTRLMSTRVELIEGTAMVESDDSETSVKDPAVTIIYKDYEIQPVKFGLLELQTSPSELKVFKGEAQVSAAGNHVIVKESRLMPFSAALLTEKFDQKVADDLYLWTRDRGAYVSAANMSSAHTVASQQSPFGYAPYGFTGRFGGSWYYNNFLDMYTFLPYSGTLWSPFGYGFFSPYSINSYYNPGQYYWYGGGGSPTSVSTGQPVNSASQVGRFGVAVNHPTLSTPIRGNVNGTFATGRGAFDRGAQTDMNAGFRGATANIGASRGISSVGSSSPAPSFSAPAAVHSAAPAAAGGGRATR